MNVSVLTIFPELFESFWKSGIVRRAAETGKITYSVSSIRDFSPGRHKSTDERPFGGGCGMVMKPEPIVAAIKAAKKETPSSITIFLSPQGKKLNQSMLFDLSMLSGIVLVCGRYEGIDERVLDLYADLEISIGDYILTGGELPAMVVIDSLVRLIPGVLGNPSSIHNDTFSEGLLEYAQYTKPRVFENNTVPEVLTSGDHAAIRKWRNEDSLIRTLLRRRDLLGGKKLTLDEIKVLNKWRLDIEEIIQKKIM